jgi:hypothetical protein
MNTPNHKGAERMSRRRRRRSKRIGWKSQERPFTATVDELSKTLVALLYAVVKGGGQVDLDADLPKGVDLEGLRALYAVGVVKFSVFVGQPGNANDNHKVVGLSDEGSKFWKENEVALLAKVGRARKKCSRCAGEGFAYFCGPSRAPGVCFKCGGNGYVI